MSEGTEELIEKARTAARTVAHLEDEETLMEVITALLAAEKRAEEAEAERDAWKESAVDWKRIATSLRQTLEEKADAILRAREIVASLAPAEPGEKRMT